MYKLKLYFLGRPRVEVNGSPVSLPRRKITALLAYLACNPSLQRRDTLATLLWPELGQVEARAALRRELHGLSSRIGSEWLRSTRNEIEWKRSRDVWMDVDSFRSHLAGCQAHASSIGPNPPDNQDATVIDFCPDCLAAFSTASELYAGDFMDDFEVADCPEFAAWHQFEKNRLRVDFSNLAQRLIAILNAQGQYSLAIGHARRWLQSDRLHEPAHRTLIHLYAVSGQSAAAIRQYQECVRILENELGVDPTPETTALFESVQSRRYRPDAKTNNSVENRESSRARKQHEYEKPGGTVDSVASSAESSAPPHAAPPVAPSLANSGHDTDAGVNLAESPAAIKHNLPSETTAFVGREDEVETIRDMLGQEEECRLLTLIGPGGIGKTRLALQVAQTFVDAAAAQWSDGIYFVGLASVSDQSDVVRAVANAVGYSFQGSGEPLAQLENFLQGKRFLLVVDNFEHLLDGAFLLSSLLGASTGLTLLATSREALDLPEEWLYPLGGLTPPTGTETLENLQTNSAVQLFLHRSRRVDAGFTLSAKNAEHVVRICQLVDGMPLGLELAAAWVNTFAVDEIAQEIASNLDILASEMRNIPERHRSLRAVFEQTWRRLTDQEQHALCRLSIFRGPFSREAAQKVANASTLDIASLVAKALARHENGRYDVHELLRQFAFERLDEEERQAVQAVHSQYYGDLLDEQARHLMTAAEDEMLTTIDFNFDNILTGWRYLVGQVGNDNASAKYASLLGHYAPPLSVYFDRFGLFREGQRIFEQALTAFPVLESGNEIFVEPWLVLHLEHTATSRRLGRYREVEQAMLESLPLFRLHERKEHLAMALTHLGSARLRLGKFEEAERDLEESIKLFDTIGLQLESTLPLVSLGMLCDRRGLFAEARTYYHTAIAIYERVGYTAGLIRCFINTGTTYTTVEEMSDAIDYYERARKLAQESTYSIGLGVISSNLGSCQQVLGNYGCSKAYYEDALQHFRDLGEIRWLTICLAEYSFSLLALDEQEKARRSLHESLLLAREHQLVIDGLVGLGAVALLMEKRNHLSLAVRIATHVLDDSRSKAEVQDSSNSVLASVAKKMAESDYADAQFQGRSTPFDIIINLAIEALE